MRPRNLEGCWFCRCVCGCVYESAAQPHRHRHESFQNCGGKNPTQEKRKKVALRHVSFSPLGQEGGRKYFNLCGALLSCRYPVVPYSTQVQEVGVEQWRTRRRHCLGFQRAGPSSEFRSPSSGRKPPNSSVVVSQHSAATNHSIQDETFVYFICDNQAARCSLFFTCSIIAVRRLNQTSRTTVT